MNYSSTALEPPEISTETTCDQNSKVPTFHTYVSFGNTENSVHSTNIAMADLPNSVEYTLQYRSNEREFVSIYAMTALKGRSCNCSNSWSRH